MSADARRLKHSFIMVELNSRCQCRSDERHQCHLHQHYALQHRARQGRERRLGDDAPCLASSKLPSCSVPGGGCVSPGSTVQLRNPSSPNNCSGVGRTSQLSGSASPITSLAGRCAREGSRAIRWIYADTWPRLSKGPGFIREVSLDRSARRVIPCRIANLRLRETGKRVEGFGLREIKAQGTAPA